MSLRFVSLWHIRPAEMNGYISSAIHNRITSQAAPMLRE